MWTATISWAHGSQEHSTGSSASFTGTISMYADAYGPPATRQAVSLAGPKATVLNDLATQYEKAHPGIKIKFIDSVPASQNYLTWVRTKATGGQLPDITWLIPLYLTSLPNGTYVDLTRYFGQPDPYVTGKTWGETFQPQITAEDAGPNGQEYVVNGDFVATAFYYNKDAFKKAGISTVPTTWSEFIADCKKLKAAGYTPFAWDVSGSPIGMDHNMTWMPRLFYSNFYSKDYKNLLYAKKKAGETVEDQVIAIKQGVFGMNDKRWMALWPIMKSFSKYWQKGFTGSDDNGQGPMLDFIHGNVGMYMDGSWASPQIQSAKPNFKWATFKIPEPGQATSQYATNYGYPGTGGPYGGSFNYLVSSRRADSTMTTAKIKAIVNWLEFISTPKHDSAIVNQIGEYIPSVIGSKPLPQLQNLSGLESTSLNMVFGGLNITPREENAVYRAYQEYVLGSISLKQYASQAQQAMDSAANQLIAKNHWDLSKFSKN